MEEVQGLAGAPFGYVVGEIQDELDRRLVRVHLVVDLDVYVELDQIADHLLAALGERTLHVQMRGVSQDALNGELNTVPHDAHRVVHAVVPTLRVGGVLFA